MQHSPKPSLYLIRHGNTFGPGDPIIWVGANEDLPLTPQGEEQGALLGQELSARISKTPLIFHAPLKRTTQTATQIAAHFPSSSLQEAEALRELDFGSWAAKTDQEIEAAFGKVEMQAWQQQAIWPPLGRWGGTQAEKAQELTSWWPSLLPSLEAQEDLILVTSNGIAREILRFLQILDPLLSVGVSPKLRTGAYGVIQYEPFVGNSTPNSSSTPYHLLEWNKRPFQAD